MHFIVNTDTALDIRGRTGGGFNTSTYFVVMDKIAHTDQKVGLASAMAVVLLLLIVIVTYAQKAVEKWLENRSSGVTK